MNQYYTANRYRRFPFVQDSTEEVADAVVVDAQIVLAQDFAVFDGGYVRLTSLVRGTGETTLVFTIGSTPTPGYKLVGLVPDDADETRILLTLKDSGDVSHPELGYGFVVIGDASTLTSLVGTTSVSTDLDPAVIRLIAIDQPLSIQLANIIRSAPSACGETSGATRTWSFKTRLKEDLTLCDELTTEPDVQQVEIDEDGAIVEVDIVPPVETVEQYIDGSETAFTTQAAAVTDSFVSVIGSVSALINGTPCEEGCEVSTGFNVDLSGSLADNTIVFNYRLGGGIGMNCSSVTGYTLGTNAADCVKSINGVHTQSGEFTLTAGAGITLIPNELNSEIMVVVNSSDLTRGAA